MKVLAKRKAKTKKEKKKDLVEIEEISYTPKYSLEEKLKELPESFALLVLVKGQAYLETVDAFVELFIKDKKLSGVYVSANKQASLLLKEFSRKLKGIDDEKLYFIDSASKTIPVELQDFVEQANSKNLVDLNISIGQALKEKKASFLILDSLSTLSIYNSEDVMKKFVKAVTEKCYSLNIKGIFIASKSPSSQELVDDISPFFDKVLDSEKI